MPTNGEKQTTQTKQTNKHKQKITHKQRRLHIMAFNINTFKPVKLSAEQTAAVAQSLGSQDISSKTPRVLDENFPLWEVIVNDKGLVYIPNFTQEVNGVKQLAVERAFIHDIRLGKQFMKIRSTQGLNGLPEELGISGQDPLSEAEQVNWDLYNKKAEIKGHQLGVDPRSDDEGMKNARRALINAFTVKQAREFYTFPIIHISTEKDAQGKNDIRKILRGADGNVVFKVYYYQVSEAQFTKQFKPIMDTLEEGETLGGQFYSFSYDTGKATEMLDNPKRDSGLNFKPTMIPMKAIDEAGRKALDQYAVEFTLEKARETIISLLLLDDEQHRAIAEQAIKPVQDELDTINLGQAQAVVAAPAAAPQTPGDVMASFGAQDVAVVDPSLAGSEPTEKINF